MESPRCHVSKCSQPAIYSDKLGRYIRECEAHQSERLERDSKRRREKNSTNTCMACSSPRDGDSVYCLAHKTSHASRMKRRRQENREQGVCVECRSVVQEPSQSRCPLHIEQQREYTNKIDSLTPQQRRHYAKYCSICGVFRVHDPQTRCICTVCDSRRTQCIEYRWHALIENLARPDSLWPPSSSTFSEKKAFGTRECRNERLVFSDMVFLLPDRLLVLECDEFSHDAIAPECEMVRMDAMQFGCPQLLPTVVLRFNPHQPDRRLVYADFDDKVRAYWNAVQELITCSPRALPPLEKVHVKFFYYNTTSPHIAAAQASSRFVVDVVSTTTHRPN